MMQKKLLIVDDDVELLKMLRQYFEHKGYMVMTASNGEEALERIHEAPDLLLLDVNMPRIDGIEVCRRIRSIVACPILFLTGKVEEQDVVQGLMAGGDDYIGKPFSLKELDARIMAHLLREERRSGKTRCRIIGDVRIDYDAMELWAGDSRLELAPIEYAIVEFLTQNAGRTYDRERIYEAVGGYDAEGDSRVITEHIRRIRGKLRKYTDIEYVETVWGCGYRWKK